MSEDAVTHEYDLNYVSVPVACWRRGVSGLEIMVLCNGTSDVCDLVDHVDDRRCSNCHVCRDHGPDNQVV